MSLASYFSTETTFGTLKITKAAAWTFTSFVVMGLSLLAAGLYAGLNEPISAGVYSIIMAPLAAYIINCVVVGKCLKLATALSVIYVIFAVLSAVVTGLLLATPLKRAVRASMSRRSRR